MKINQALEYIHSVSWRGSKPGLERISKLCAGLGNPQDKLKFIHVAGTNGKGSVCAFLSSILTSAGFKTGRFTSPYIVCFNDRICVDGVPISDNDLARIVEKVMPVAESLEDKPTEFELITAIGFLFFLEQKCDIVVLEVGLGGEKDSTNVIKSPLLSIITGIDLDHTELLGATTAAIAKEKAGIIKQGCPVLVGEVDDDAICQIEKKAIEKNAPLFKVKNTNTNVISQTLEGTVFDFEDFESVHISLLGVHQTQNASLALAAAKHLSIDKSAIYKGISAARWPARFELLSTEPTVIYDGGHNRQGIRACIDSYKKYFDKKAIVISGVMRDKEVDCIASAIAEVAYQVITLAPDNPRALSAEEYAKLFEEKGLCASFVQGEKQAAQKAIELAKKQGLPILCTGSLYAYQKLSRAISDALAKN